jgi:hypothetical protein
MEKQVGLWIDHRKAVIVTLQNGIAETREIDSDMEKHVRFSSGTHAKDSNDSQGSTAEDVRDRQFGDHLNLFYGEVIALIRDAESIWILGPGEAKGELENRLKHEDLGARVVGIETEDKMTTPQIIAKVKSLFAKKHGKEGSNA